MFLKSLMTKSTEKYSDKIKKLKNEIVQADAVMIGAGSGLSTSAGFTYSGERFRKYFGDFAENMGFLIYIPEVFILIQHWRNIGRGGVVIYIIIAMQTCPNRFIRIYWSW